MGLGKVILAIFGVFILLLIILGIDLFMTINSLSDADPETLVSNPVYNVAGDGSLVTISVDVDLPSAGFIPKGVIIKLIVDFNGDVQDEEEEINLGDSKTIDLVFTMTAANQNALQNGSISVTTSAEVTPIYLGQTISQGKQNVDLGTTAISL